jgi:hypothetical protein
MVEAKTDGAVLKPLLRLLRLARIKVLIRPSGDGVVELLRQEDQVLLGRIPETLVQHALSQGLVQQQGERLQATAQAESFMRRILAQIESERFSAQHGEVADAVLVEPEGKRIVRRNLDDSPLSSLSRLRDKAGAAYFPADAIDAGERLAMDFERGHLQPRVTASWEPKLAQKQKGQRSAGVDVCDSALSARDRVTKAVIALGPELSGVALDVCCFAKGLEIVERERQWPARSAKLMLRTALMALARHYTPVKPSSPSLTRHWGEAGFRPEIAEMAR